MLKGAILILALHMVISGCRHCENKTVSYVEQEPYETIEEAYEKLSYHIPDEVLHYKRVEGAILVGDSPKLNVKCSVVNDGEKGGTLFYMLYLVHRGTG